MVIDIPIMFFDGESSDNPGQGAAAAILLMPNGKRFTVSQLLSSVTTQEAEYRGLIIGLEKAKKLGINRLEVKGDSETVFNQINSLTQVFPDRLKPLHLEARKLMRHFDKVSVEYISVEQNRSARAAVQRCIDDALGRDQSKPVTTAKPRVLPVISEIIALGENATERDYRKLRLEELDEYSVKSLTELRPFVPTDVQDVIALQWNGKEEELAEMYRWYLRGLPPDMAIQKVKIDNIDKDEPIPEKLPWEEALIIPSSTPFLDDETEQLPPLDNTLIRGENTSDRSESLSSPLEPIDPKTQETFLSLASFAENGALPHQETLLLSDAHLDLYNPPISDSPSFGNGSQNDNGKDTLPDRTRVSNILELIYNLSPNEKQELSHELLKSPEMVQIILQTMAKALTTKTLF